MGGFVDGDWTNFRGDHGLFGMFNGQQTMRWSWAVGGRVGGLVTPSLLAYFSGGYTQAEFSGFNYSHNNATSSIATTAPGSTVSIVATGNPPGIGGLPSRRYDGFFIGGGTEYAISQFPGLFWKSEYRYADYGNTQTNIICAGCTFGTPQAVGLTGLAERGRTTVQTVRTELVWRFNWAGPVVAKY